MRATLAGPPSTGTLAGTSGSRHCRAYRLGNDAAKCHRTAPCGILLPVIGRWQPDRRGIDVPDASTSRGPEHRVAALTLAALLVIGGLMGIDQPLRGRRAPRRRRRSGSTPPRWRSASLAAIPLVVRKRASRRHTFGLVLLGDLIYLVVVFCIEDPVRYATPLMLLFPAFVAAWFLGAWELGVNMVVTTVVCLVALWPSYDNAVASASRSG